MRILFTGGSSFTGLWFVRELAASGHAVTATLRQRRGDYQGMRGLRVRELEHHCERIVENCSFGDDSFLHLVSGGGWNVLCHHAAQTEGYRDPGFDATGAMAENTRRLSDVLEIMSRDGAYSVVLTGSVFEADEGQRDDEELPAFSAYGLSKTLTYQVFRFYARRAGLHLGKFVIPNPFGPMEEPRYTNYLITAWLRGDVPTVRTPDYVRDNIHVSLLAKCYADFASTRPLDTGVTHLAPSGYRETQGEFTLRLAHEMRPRLDCECAVEMLHQEDFPEPRVRVNPDRVAPGAFDWTERSAWDALAEFYLRLSLA